MSESNWEIFVRARAKSDLRKARDWYDRQREGLGDDFLRAIAAAIARLEANPHICQIYYKKFRQILPDTFPYRIIYFIDGDRIIIARVFHSAQDFSSQM